MTLWRGVDIFYGDFCEGSRGTDELLEVPLTVVVQYALGSQNDFDFLCQATCFIYCNTNKLGREVQWVVLR